MALIDLIFCAVASLKALSMNVFDAETKILDTEKFSQHSITDLNSGITFIVLFTQEKPLRNKHTYRHTMEVKSSCISGNMFGMCIG